MGIDFPGGSDGKASAYNVGDPGSIPGLGRSLEKGMATHSSILAPPPKKRGSKKYFSWGFPGGSEGKASACDAEDPSSIPGSGRSLEKEMATHSSTLAWKIPWTEECRSEERRVGKEC